MGNELIIDLIPQTSWYSNARTFTAVKDWNKLRKIVYERANNKCECCKNTKRQLEVHERWEWDTKTNTQRLKRLICLCYLCHAATHMGCSQIRGIGNEAKKHIMTVRNWTEENYEEHEKDAWERWAFLNKIKDWKIDLYIVEKAGITLIDKRDLRTKYYKPVNNTEYDFSD